MKLARDFLRDLALNREHVFQITIVIFRPDVRIGASVDQLRVYVKPGTCLADAPSRRGIRLAHRRSRVCSVCPDIPSRWSG